MLRQLRVERDDVQRVPDGDHRHRVQADADRLRRLEQVVRARASSTEWSLRAVTNDVLAERQRLGRAVTGACGHHAASVGGDAGDRVLVLEDQVQRAARRSASSAAGRRAARGPRARPSPGSTRVSVLMSRLTTNSASGVATTGPTPSARVNGVQSLAGAAIEAEELAGLPLVRAQADPHAVVVDGQPLTGSPGHGEAVADPAACGASSAQDLALAPARHPHAPAVGDDRPHAPAELGWCLRSFSGGAGSRA